MSIVSETATLAYGFTMADIDNIARIANSKRRTMLDAEEALAVAWHGAVVALYEAKSEPTWSELIVAGMNALRNENNRLNSHWGIRHSGAGDRLANLNATPEHGIAPSFNKYWGVRNDGDDGFTEGIAERLALPAVLGVLSAREYEAISTLAAFDGDIRAAAAALGMNYPGYKKLVGQARKCVVALWFEHETPRSRKPREPGKCRNGHSRANHGSQDTQGRWDCRLCRQSKMRRAGWRRNARRKAEAGEEEFGGPEE